MKRERIKDVFEDPTVIPSCQYILNTHVSSETGYAPFELLFGTSDKIYTNLLSKCDDNNISHVLLQRLNVNLQILKDASKKYQQSLLEKRFKDQYESKQNKYQPGDLVLFDAGPKPHPKMAARFKGPFEVVHQYRNDVDCRDLISGAV